MANVNKAVGYMYFGMGLLFGCITLHTSSVVLFIAVRLWAGLLGFLGLFIIYRATMPCRAVNYQSDSGG